MCGGNGGPPIGINPAGPAANSVCGLPRTSFAALAASSRSAGVPWRSPRESFLYAYVTEMGRLHRNWPFMASMAASDASKLSKDTKPKPRLLPCARSEA